MKPTQAQIEVATQEIMRGTNLILFIDEARVIASAALTAAAQVGRKTMSDPQELEQCEPNRSRIIAAQVREPEQRGQEWRGGGPFIDALKALELENEQIKAATIERCAQVANDFLIQIQKDYDAREQLSVTNIVGMLCNLIAAIRKLKDAP